MDIFKDTWTALKLSSKASYKASLQAWVYTPFGVTLILLIIYGIHCIINLSGVQFPASVACMILLFLFFLLLEMVWGPRVNQIYAVVEIPAGFGLRYLNVFFTPSFILLPLSPSIGGVEIAKIIGVFLLGYGIVIVLTAILTRQLHLLLGVSKRALAERSDQPHPSRPFDERIEREDEIPLAQRHGNTNSVVSVIASTSLTRDSSVQSLHGYGIAAAQGSSDILYPIEINQPESPISIAEIARIRGVGPTSADGVNRNPNPLPIQQPLRVSLTRAQNWAAYIIQYRDFLTFSILFLIGLPIYLITGTGSLAQLSLNILAYQVAISVPVNIKRYLHPVLGCSILSILGLWMMALIHNVIHGLPARQALTSGLHEYSKGLKYLVIFTGQSPRGAIPGAGDFLSSLLDVGILGLALPIFRYRQELYRHYMSILIPALTFSTISLFAYPALCYTIGISPARSLSFAARSLTLALATPAVSNLQGDTSLLAVLAIMSGIIGVLTGDYILQLLKVPADDYVTRGVTLGSVSSAIATAHLLTSDPRAAALSSLTLVVFGTWMVILTAMPPVVMTVWSLVDIET